MTTRRILIIDDDELIGAVAKLGLERQAGWHVTHATSAAAGIAEAIANPPDVILLDVEMPGKSGPEVASELSDLDATRRIPVVMVSASEAEDVRQRCGSLNPAGIIAKPFDLWSLPSRLAALMGWSEALALHDT